MKNEKSHCSFFKQPIYLIIYSGSVYNVSDWKRNKHSHSFSEILFIKKGRGQILINENKYNVQYGDIVVYKPNDSHQELAYENEEFQLYFVAIKDLDATNPSPVIDPALPPIISTNVYALKFENYFADVIEEMQNKNNYETDLPIYYAGILVSMVRKLYQDKYIANSDLTSICKAIKEIIDRDFCKIRQLDDILKDLYISKYYFYEKFKEIYGLTPLQYLRGKKLKYSQELLGNTNLKVAEIAFMVGFENKLYFSRIFKQDIGISPTEYRDHKK
jgi:AraC family transcriptional regulator of arabinose operon